MGEALDSFYAEGILEGSGGPREKHWGVVKKFLELQAAFPFIAENALHYHEADKVPAYPEFDETLVENLFNLMISLRSFFSAGTLAEFVRLHKTLREEIYNVAKYSEDYNMVTGAWK